MAHFEVDLFVVKNLYSKILKVQEYFHPINKWTSFLPDGTDLRRNSLYTDGLAASLESHDEVIIDIINRSIATVVHRCIEDGAVIIKFECVDKDGKHCYPYYKPEQLIKMTTKEKLISMLVSFGMFESQAVDVIGIAIPALKQMDPDYNNITWDRPWQEYPALVYSYWFNEIKPIALDWINKNKPKAWFRDLFKNELYFWEDLSASPDQEKCWIVSATINLVTDDSGWRFVKHKVGYVSQYFESHTAALSAYSEGLVEFVPVKTAQINE